MTEVHTNSLSHNLLEWWTKKQRKFPWRENRNPYKVLISEVLLHRTRAEQVVPVYYKVIKQFPTIEVLSKANRAELEALLYPLGLRWRTECLLEMAQLILVKYDGKIPALKGELEALPGISDYIASAVRCFGFGYPESLLDTNIVRILGRVFGIEVTDGSRRSKKFKELSKSILDEKNSQAFNYAMLDLGALVCTPKKPLCQVCPLKCMCIFGMQQLNNNFRNILKA